MTPRPEPATIEVYADVWCPFAHVGLRWLRRRRGDLGRGDVPIRVRAWPLELVNGTPQDPARTLGHVEALRAQVAPELFGSFDASHFPRSTLGALALAAAAYRAGVAAGEGVSFELRDLLFEEGVDVSDARVLDEVGRRHDVSVLPADRADVIADWHRGRALGVRGSPHLFCGSHDMFCPSLDISHGPGGDTEIRARADRLADFIDRCLLEGATTKGVRADAS